MHKGGHIQAAFQEGAQPDDVLAHQAFNERRAACAQRLQVVRGDELRAVRHIHVARTAKQKAVHAGPLHATEGRTLGSALPEQLHVPRRRRRGDLGGKRIAVDVGPCVRTGVVLAEERGLAGGETGPTPHNNNT